MHCDLCRARYKRRREEASQPAVPARCRWPGPALPSPPLASQACLLRVLPGKRTKDLRFSCDLFQKGEKEEVRGEVRR